MVMPEQDYTMTENLSQVIDTIQIGRKTGVLTVQRGEGALFESGMVIFVSGRPVRAQAGYLNSMESLEWLNTWRQCRFAFLPYIPPDLALASSALLPSKSPPSQGLPNPAITGKYPTLPGAQSVGGSNSGFFGSQAGPPSFLQSAPYRIKQVDEAIYIMDQQGFPRLYRRLILLLDGSRTIADLAQLLGQSPDEIYRLVGHLEAAGLVQH